MIRISATKLRNNLFEYLDRIENGETIVILRNKQEVARLASIHPADWRDKMDVRPELLVPPEEVIGPLEDGREESRETREISF